MKSFFSLLFLLITVISANASHLVGGEMSFDCLGGNQYRIYLDLYRDADPRNIPNNQQAPTPFDTDAYFVVFDAVTNAIVDSRNVALRDETPVLENDLGACLTSPPVINFWQGKYDFVINLPPNVNGYKIVHIRCCRAPGITNLSASGNQGSTYMLHISNESLLACNSSPKFKFSPPILLCAKLELDFDHSAVDLEGDEVRYKLCAPLTGGSPNCPFYGPSTVNPNLNCFYDPPPPPYQEVIFNNGFSAQSPLGGNSFGQPVLNLNENSGRMLLTPQAVGKFVVGICMEEFRGGKLMSRSYRDFQFNVYDCGVALASLALLPDYECSTLSVDFSNHNSVGGKSYNWNFGDGSTSSQERPIHKYDTPGTYTVNLTINEGEACESQAQKTIDVYPDFVVDFEYIQDCNDDKLVFTNKSYSSLTIDNVNSTQWFFDGVKATSVSNPVYDISNETNLAVKLLATSTKGCKDSLEINIPIEEKPTVKFNVTEACVGQNIQIDNQSFTNTGTLDRFRWVIENNIYVDREPIVQFDQPGPKEFLLAAYSTSGCKDSILTTINITDSVSLKILKPDLVCNEQYAEFMVLSDGKINTYDWNFGNGETSSEETGSVIFDDPGSYQIELLVNTELCGEKSRRTNINVGTTPEFDLPQSLDICAGFTEDIRLVVTNVTNPDILWSNGVTDVFTTVSSDDESLSVVVAKDGCSRKKEVSIVNKCEVYVPNAFAPGGLNRGFTIINKNVASFELYVYNRWGELLFATSDFNNPWDGNYKGNPAPMDTYAYSIKGEKLDGKPFEQRGAFTLIR